MKAIGPSCKAQRTKIQPACLLAINGVKPTTAGDDISNNHESEWAKTRLIEKSPSDANRPDHAFFSLLITSHNMGDQSVSGSFVFHPSTRHKPCSDPVSLTCLAPDLADWIYSWTVNPPPGPLTANWNVARLIYLSPEVWQVLIPDDELRSLPKCPHRLLL